jgi:hypothetical protein
MGAQSDFISEQFMPSERHKAQQQAMAETLRAAGLNPGEFDNLSTPEETVRMARPRIQPHLIDYQGAHRCSICKMPFSPDASPFQEQAFAEHVRKAHRPGQTSEDVNQGAARIVNQTTRSE